MRNEKKHISLTRDYFKDKIEDIKNQNVCIIPEFDNTIIDLIEDDTFKDWENLEYVAIPKNVKSVSKEAFNWDKLKLVVSSCKLPIDIDVIQIPYNETNVSLITLMTKVSELEEKMNLNPEKIKEKQEFIMGKFKEIEELQSRIKEIQEDEFSSNLNSKIDLSIKEKVEQTLTSLEKAEKTLKRQTESSNTALSEAEQKLQAKINEEAKKEIDNCLKTLKEAEETLKKQRKTSEDIISEINKKVNEIFSKNIFDIENYFQDSESRLKSRIENHQGKLETISHNVISELEGRVDNIVEQVCEEALDRIKDRNQYKTVEININGVKKTKLKGMLFHKKFDDVLKVLSLRLHPLLVGPAGSGKNVILEQVAKALNLEFYYVNDVTEEHKVMGFVDANGNFQQTQFFKAFTNGGLIMIDEMDNSHPSALLSINAALGTGYHQYLTFPDGVLYESNSDFYLAGAANTYGTGNDMIYCGRSSLDGASLNRFVPIFIDYDRDLESNLVQNQKILELYWAMRDSIVKNRIRHVISTRNIVNADKMLDSNMFSLGQIFDYTLIQSLTDDDLRIVLQDLSKKSDFMVNEFIKHLSTRNISRNEYYSR